MTDTSLPGGIMSRCTRKRTSKWDTVAEPQNEIENNEGEHMKPDFLYKNWSRDDPTMQTRQPSLDSPKWEDQKLVKDYPSHSSKKSSPESLLGKQESVRDGDTNRQEDGSIAVADQIHNRNLSSRPATWRQPKHSVSPRGGRNMSRRSRSWSRSPGRSWSKSGSRSGSRSRSRSRSPYYGTKGKLDRWSGRSRVGVGSAAPCRDFAAGRCRKGGECRYLHDVGRKQYDRYQNSRREMEDGRYERRYLDHEAKGGIYESRRHRDNFGEKLHRSGNLYDHERNGSEQYRDKRVNERCYDFTQGRCHRGSMCRYIHHDTSSDGGRYMQDKTRERTPDKSEADRDHSQRIEPHRVTDTPCKFFAEGRCRRGEGCKYSHQIKPHDNSDGREPHSKFSHQIIPHDNSDGREPHSKHDLDGTNMSHWTSKETSSYQSGDNEHSRHESQHIQHVDSEYNQYPLVQQAPQHPLSLQEQNVAQEPSEPYEKDEIMATKSAGSQTEVNIIPPLAPIPSRSFNRNAQNQYVVPQPLYAHGFNPDGKLQQAVNSQPPSWQGQVVGPANSQDIVGHQAPSNPQILNLSAQPVVPSPNNGLVQQNYSLGPQLTQGFPFVGQRQQNPGPTTQTLHGISIPSQNDGQTLEINAQQNEQNQQKFDISNENQQTAPLLRPLQTQHLANALVSNGPIPQEVLPISNLPLMDSEKKAIPIEKAAQITNLSASLAQFFANGPQIPQLYATLNPLAAASGSANALSVNSSSAGPPVPEAAPHGVLNVAPSIQQQPDNGSDSLVPPGFSSVPNFIVEPQETKIESIGVEKKMNENSDATQAELNAGIESAAKSTSKNKEAAIQSTDAEEVYKGEDIKRNKDDKAMRMFKSSLVDLVKDMLKPSWREGRLSKEAHKAIVKKVIEKVTGAIQGPNVPQTPDKIDSYLAHSKAKLNKLVQAYVDKYVKS